ncbi:hypothetical protein [Aureispira anguillae]|uniref:Uncharacterized protein n=1 Tax=Aureispira anguillae TaxID=2864201 RepID=A0A915YE38_9BACT|nr:hypothetical protein [Aureispira anguillae]BDS11326.1 hypothetical protein AsAng_0020380 [Aureispira anguillae]
MRIIDSTLFSPFYIFIKASDLSDSEVLNLLGIKKFELLNKYQKHPKNWQKKRTLFITECKNWIHIMDFMDYNLWHNPQLRINLELISKKYDIFYCSTGDDDYSYDFTYLKEGILKRKLIVEYPNYKGPIIKENIGKRLLGESEKIVLKDERKEVLSIAKAIGINLNHEESKIRQYLYEL